MALSGWGLTPGTLEKNVTRSLGGKYGSIGNDANTVGNMIRQKYSAGLEAKKAKEKFDFTKAAEETRKGEATRAFGLDTEKLDFSKAQESTRAEEEARRLRLDEQQFGLAGEKFMLDKANIEQSWADETRNYQLAVMNAQTLEEKYRLDNEHNKKLLEYQNAWNTASDATQNRSITSADRASSARINAANEAARLAKVQAGRDQLAAQRAKYDAAMAGARSAKTYKSPGGSNIGRA